MLFNSYGFIFLFLPAVWLGFFALARIRSDYAATWLALASLFFYGYWNPVYLGLLLASISCNYLFGMWIAKAAARGDDAAKKRLLIVAIAINLLALCYYKYANFFLDSMNAVAGSDWTLWQIVLPLGISFYTFTQIAFLVDTWQGKVKEYNFTHYVLFVTYFPHLIAGPVLHHKEMMPQFAHPATYRINWNNVASGMMLFTLGLCKKVLMADALAPFATGIFDGIQQGAAHGVLPAMHEAWFGALAYTFQIYFDFSGYTDMALGIALMFGIRLPTNFNSPYKATSIIEFWRRWHMTLSRFLRDYLYIPLGGNRLGKARRYLNLMITMALGGLWHGAGWTFILWGLLHGIYLAINHLWREIFPATATGRWSWPARLIGGGLTFIAVVTAWVLFRANDVTHALVILKAMYGISDHADIVHALPEDLFKPRLKRLLVLSFIWVWLFPNSSRLRFIGHGYILTALQVIVVLYFLNAVLSHFGSYSPFLYFQF
ncbi:MAG: MBOAT family protein [Methylobacillus sp.]|jgi:alginate O-acetyltransferase complex protein AlgI|nr:MBOAT family protein [Methylobacillus sp.]